MEEAPPTFDRSFWDERYRSQSHAHLWSGNPNVQLVAEMTGVTPGAALDVGAGEGADAVWLAEQGWQVTAVDLSDVALERAAAHASERGDDVASRITWRQADVIEWAPEVSSYDLVSSHYMHPAATDRAQLFGRLGAAVRPGGTLLIVGHHPSDLDTTMRRPRVPDLMFTAEDVAACLPAAGWTIEACDARPRPEADPDGNVVTIHDSVLRATRH